MRGLQFYVQNRQKLVLIGTNDFLNRYSAEDVSIDDQLVVARGQLIDKKIAEQLQASDLESIKIMSGLSAST